MRERERETAGDRDEREKEGDGEEREKGGGGEEGRSQRRGLTIQTMM